MADLREHTAKRIREAKAKSNGDEQKFNNLMMLRARRCGKEKIHIFVEVLKDEGYADLAAQIEIVSLGWDLASSMQTEQE